MASQTIIGYFTAPNARLDLVYNPQSLAVTSFNFTNNTDKTIYGSATTDKGQTFSSSCPPHTTKNFNFPNNVVHITDPNIEFGGVVVGVSYFEVR